MNVFLLGATGGTGKEVLAKLLAQHYQVVALARNPDAITIVNSNLKVIKGNVYDAKTFQDELGKCDAVVSCLGAENPKAITEIYSKGGANILTAMRHAKVKRLITLTASAFDQTDPGNKRFFLKYFVTPMLKNIYSDMQTWENILESAKDIDWTVVRPSLLLNGKEKGKYRVEIKNCPKSGIRINRKDLADFIVKQINSDEYLHQKVAIAY